MKLVLILSLTMIGLVTARGNQNWMPWVTWDWREWNREKANVVKKSVRTRALNPHGAAAGGLALEPHRAAATANLIRNADDGDGSRYVGGAMIGASHIFVVKVKKGINWDNARNACQKKGGDLAVLMTYKAIDAIAPFTLFDGEVGEYWIGAKNPSKKKSDWKWLTGEPIPLSYGGWRVGRKGVNTKQPDGNEDCLAYCNRSGDDDTRGLCDWGCTSGAEGYICQIPSK